MKRRSFFIITFLSLTLLPVFCQERHDGQISRLYEGLNRDNTYKISDEYIGFYQKYISGLRGSQCAMYPSCSNYGLKVFRDRPFYEAMLYTADRMLRCGHDKAYYNVSIQYGEMALLDWPPYEKTPRELFFNGTTSYFTDSDHKKDTLSFINHLINHQQYEMALLEITRYMYFNASVTPLLYKNKLLCWEALGKEEEGIYEYETQFPQSVRKNPIVTQKVAKLYYNIENYDMALSSLRKGEKNMDKNEYYRNCVFQSIIETKKGNYPFAISIMEKLQDEYPEYADLSQKNLQIMTSLANTPQKKPYLARLLSIFPGGGYAYTKQYQTAFTSLLINSVLAWATYNCIKNDNYGMATLTGIFSLTFYIGNITGAGRSAQRYNQQIKNRYIQGLTELNNINSY